MRPVNIDLQPWDDRTANFELQRIRARAIADLNDRDERNSQGQLSKANKYSPYREVVDDRGTGSTFVVDPVLAAMKCTGADLIQLTCKRWAEFCEKPQDDKPFIEALLKHTREIALNRMSAAGQGVEDSLRAAPKPTASLPEKPKAKAKEPTLIG